jgi:hypothetical protein
MPAIGNHISDWLRARPVTQRDGPMLTSVQRIGLVVLGLLWLIDGLLQLQPYFFEHFVEGVLAPNASGQPGIVGEPITLLVNVLSPVQAPFNAFAAIVESGVGVALLTRRAVRPALLVSFTWALGIWFAGEGLGGIFTSSTPNAFSGVIGTAPMYILTGLLAWPRRQPDEQTIAPAGLLGSRGARSVWALLWIAGGALWLLPANDSPDSLHGLFSSAPAGASWLSSLQSDAARAVAGDGRGLAIALATVSVAVGVSVFSQQAERIGLIASIPILLMGWVLVEGFGALFTGRATDVGTNPLLLLLAVQLLALSVERASARTQPHLAAAGSRI